MEDQEKTLAPLRFTPVPRQFDWGTQRYLLADLGDPDTKVSRGELEDNSLGELMETYLERLSGENAYYYYGRQFPICVSEISVETRTPLLVCPDDATAGPRYDALGKAKLWYVVDADEKARMAIGLRAGVTAEELYAGCTTGMIYDRLHWFSPRPGTAWLVPPAAVHCLEGHIRVIEIAEASLIDLVLCDWKSVEPDGLSEALDFVDMSACDAPEPVQALQRPEFMVNVLHLAAPQEISQDDGASFVVYVCVKGSVSVQIRSAAGTDGSETVVLAGETVLVPAEVPSFVLTPRLPGTVVIEATLGSLPVPDSYINTD